MEWNALIGRKAKADYYDPISSVVFLRVGQTVDQHALDRLDVLELVEVEGNLHGVSVGAESRQWIRWGRFRSAVARALLRSGSGVLRINGKPVEECFRRSPRKAREFLQRLLKHEKAELALSQMEAIVLVEGSDPTTLQQPKAVAHAIAKALWDYDPTLREELKKGQSFGGVKVKKSERFRKT